MHGPQPERVVSEADLLVGARVEGLEAAERIARLDRRARALAEAFPRISDPALRQAVSRVVEALASRADVLERN